jgi:hypothetical protein
VRLKLEIYRLFTRLLIAAEYNDEPGTIVQSIAFVGEGSELLLQKLFWQSPGLLLNFTIQVGLIFSSHPSMFGIFCGWILLHLVSNAVLMHWRKRFTVRYQQSTSAFKGRLVGFARHVLYTPERRYSNQFSDEMYQLDQSLATRARHQLIDWNIGETIHLLYNGIHGLFMICALMLMLVLWQDGLITTGDIAMGVSIMLSTQRMLRETSMLLTRVIEAYAQVEAGLLYIHSKQRKGLMAPKYV